MIAVSSTVKTDCNSPRLQYKEFITVDSNTVEIKGKMSNSCYNDGNIFGTFIMKKLEFTTENDIGYKGKEVEYYKSVNGESFKIGTYIVTEIKDNDSDETVTVTALDYGLKSAIPYVTSLDYASGEVTLFDVLTEACSNAGLTLKNTSITNGDFIVDSNQFTNNELIGDVIKAVAHISGDFATINEDDKVQLVYEEETDEIIEDYEELADKRDTLPITSISIGTSQVSGQEAILRDEDMIAEYGEHWLILNDNPFAYTLEKRQELVTAVFNKVKGFSYSSFESSYSFKPYLQLGDKIQFRNKAGELVNSRILRIDTDYDDIKLSAPSIIKATVDYKNSPDALEVAKRAEIVANQATSTISLVVSEQTSQGERLVSVEQNVEGISTVISDVNDIKSRTTIIEENVTGLTNTMKETAGLNILHDAPGYFKNDYWSGPVKTIVNTDILDNTRSDIAFDVQNGTIEQTVNVQNGIYTLSGFSKKLLELSNLKVTVNDVDIPLNEMNWKQFVHTFEVNSRSITVKVTADTNSAGYVSDLMLNSGDLPQVFSLNQNETYTDAVKIGKGLTIEGTNTNTKLQADSDGVRIRNKNTDEVKTEFTDEGTKTDKLTANSAQIAQLLIQNINGQVCFNNIGGVM